MATDPLLITDAEALAAGEVADDAIRVLKATAINPTGDVVADLLPGFDDPTSNISGVYTLIKAVSVGMTRRHADGTSANLPNTVVRRDNTGSFAANAISVNKIIFNDGSEISSLLDVTDNFVNRDGDTMTGDLNINADLFVNSNAIAVRGTQGRVGINRADPEYALDVFGSSQVSGSSRVGGALIFTSAPSNDLKINLNGASGRNGFGLNTGELFFALNGNNDRFAWKVGNTAIMTLRGNSRLLVGPSVADDGTSVFQAQGMIYSRQDGYKFPDGTIQTTAAFNAGSVENIVLAQDAFWVGRSAQSNLRWVDADTSNSQGLAVLNSKGSLFLNIDSNNNDSSAHPTFFIVGTDRSDSTGGTDLLTLTRDGHLTVAGSFRANNTIELLSDTAKLARSAGNDLSWNDASGNALLNAKSSVLININSDSTGTDSVFAVGINGTSGTTSKVLTVSEVGNLTVPGFLESTSSGFKFPDGTIQLTAAFGTGSGEVNSATNRGSGEGVYSDKFGIDLRFKSLVEGDGIALSSDDEEITLEIAPSIAKEITFNRQTVGDIAFNIATPEHGTSSSTFYPGTANNISFRGHKFSFGREALDVVVGAPISGSSQGFRSSALNVFGTLDNIFQLITQSSRRAGWGLFEAHGHAGLGVGTSENYPLMLYTNRNEIMRLLSGNVAIGALNPTRALHIQVSRSNNELMLLRNTLNAGGSSITMEDLSGVSKLSVGYNNPGASLHAGEAFIASGAGTDLKIGVGLVTHTKFKTNGNLEVDGSTFFVDAVNDLVGIGTLTPASKLEVAGTIHSTSGGFKFPDGTIQITASDGGSGTGEVNTASNIGSGIGVFSDKVGVDLRFKSLIEGEGINLSSDATSITISADHTLALNPSGEDWTITILPAGSWVF